MAATKLGIYNDALVLLGERALANDTEDREPRYDLDNLYDNGGVDYCLELVKPRYSSKVDSITGVTPTLETEYTYEATLPADFLALVGVFADGKLEQRVKKFYREGNFILSEHQATWVRYIRDFAATGLTNMPPSFARVVSAYFARELAVKYDPDSYEDIVAELAVRIQLVESVEDDNDSESISATGLTLTEDWRAVYNGALALLGQDLLSTITDDSEYKTRIDLIRDQGADYCLELLKPRFATKMVELTGVTPTSDTDYTDEGTLPAGFLSMVGLYADGKMKQPITNYYREGNFILSDTTSMWVRYVQDMTTTGFTNTTSSFRNVLSAYFAREVSIKYQPELLPKIEEEFQRRTTASLDIEDGAESDTISITGLTLDNDWRLIYNDTMTILGLDQIESNTDDSERKIRIDLIRNQGADYCLEMVKPRFATLVTDITGSAASVDTAFVYQATIPAGYLATVGIYSDGKLEHKVSRYVHEANYILSDYQNIFFRHVRDIATVGLTNATNSFKNLMSAYFAREIAAKYDQDKLERADAILQERFQITLDIESKNENLVRALAPTTLTDTWRKIYNDALLILGLDPIATNTDDSLPKNRLDIARDADLVEAVLEDTSWGFGSQSDQIFYDPGVDPAWGYTWACAKPADLHRMNGIYADEFFRVPIREYIDEDGYFYSSYDVVYIEYVSTDFLSDPTLWPAYFRRLVAARMAKDAGAAIPNANVLNAESQYKTRRSEAMSTDAMNSPPKIFREGSWAATRGNQYQGRRDRP